MSSKWEDERWCVDGCWGHSHQTKANKTQPTNNGLGLVYIIYIYIYNKLSVRTLFVWRSLFVGTKKLMNSTKQSNWHAHCRFTHNQGRSNLRHLLLPVGEIIQNQRTTFCVASQQSFSLSLSLSLLLASDYWSLMSDCNKFFLPFPQRLAFS
jgi:hypothetical protein